MRPHTPKKCWVHAVPTLLETQRRFLAALYNDDDTGPDTSIVGDGLASEARLQIYRHSCEATQAAAMRTTYPAVLALVGEAFFEQTVRGYRRAYPSRSGNLQAFGDHLADYLATLPALHQLPYLPDVARLEWLCQESALASGAGGPAPDSATRLLATIGGPWHVVLDPSVRLFTSRYPVLTVWHFAMQPVEGGLTLPDDAEHVVLWRDEANVAMAALDVASFACIEALMRNRALAEARAAGRVHDPDFNFAACMRSFVDRGLFVMLSTTPSCEGLPQWLSSKA